MSALVTSMMMFSMETTGHPPKGLSQDMSSFCTRPTHSFEQCFPVPVMCQELCLHLDVTNDDFNPEGSEAMVSPSQFYSGTSQGYRRHNLSLQAIFSDLPHTWYFQS